MKSFFDRTRVAPTPFRRHRRRRGHRVGSPYHQWRWERLPRPGPSLYGPRASGESAAVYVREGDLRVCLHRHDFNQSIRHSARVGDALPLDRGAPGRVILAFSGTPGHVYDEIRERGYHATIGERDPQVASLAVPIYRDGRKLFGSMALTGPTPRFTEDAINRNLKFSVRLPTS